jgi:SAM-dependent methyltransferase
VSFEVAADAYDRFMGRYSGQLSSQLSDLAGIDAGQRVLDVGCGPGALTSELVLRLGPGSVAAVDPSEPFVIANAKRHPGVDVRRGSAEILPFADDEFDAALAQLVVHFMSDPVRGLGEMARVTRPGGRIAACVWDHWGGRGPVNPYWDSARELDPDLKDESLLAGSREGHLAELFETAGLHGIVDTALASRVTYATFEEWWEPFTLGVGPAGAHAARLDPNQLVRLRELSRARLPEAPFTHEVWAWAACGVTDG